MALSWIIKKIRVLGGGVDFSSPFLVVCHVPFCRVVKDEVSCKLLPTSQVAKQSVVLFARQRGHPLYYSFLSKVDVSKQNRKERDLLCVRFLQKSDLLLEAETMQLHR